MKKVLNVALFIISLTLFNSCSEESADQPCPESENISMIINGEERQFYVIGRGIDLDSDGSGHTLQLNLVSGEYYPQQDTHSLVIKLPYKQTGENIIEEFRYTRTQNATSLQGYFGSGQLQSQVTVNKNSCISATISGTTIIDGNEVVITDGVIDVIYSEPFENH